MVKVNVSDTAKEYITGKTDSIFVNLERHGG